MRFLCNFWLFQIGGIMDCKKITQIDYKNSANPKAMIGDVPVYCSHDEIVDIMKVVPNPRNPNMHTQRQIEILAQVIKAQGWRKPITVSKRSGFVVSGHGRLQAAILLQ